MSEDQLTAYYLQQGKGGGSEGAVYRASYQRQRGYGVFARLLSRLWRTARPLLTSGAKYLGNQALSTGGQILTDLASKPADVQAKDIAKRRLDEAGQAIASKAGVALKKMAGGGRKRRKQTTRKRQLGRGKRKQTAQRATSTKRATKRPRKQSRVGRVRTCSAIGDIFG